MISNNLKLCSAMDIQMENGSTNEASVKEEMHI
jgi:hypothetical protein